MTRRIGSSEKIANDTVCYRLKSRREPWIYSYVPLHVICKASQRLLQSRGLGESQFYSTASIMRPLSRHHNLYLFAALKVDISESPRKSFSWSKWMAAATRQPVIRATQGKHHFSTTRSQPNSIMFLAELDMESRRYRSEEFSRAYDWITGAVARCLRPAYTSAQLPMLHRRLWKCEGDWRWSIVRPLCTCFTRGHIICSGTLWDPEHCISSKEDRNNLTGACCK